VTELATGGTVIGPLVEVKFQRGVVHMEPGDVLVACTDGILDRRSPDGEFFGEARLRRLVEESPGPAAALLETAESMGVLARALLRVRFTYLCAASRTE